MSDFGSLVQLCVIGTVCGLLIAAAVCDVRRFVIPNRICLSLLILYPGHAVTLAPMEILVAVAAAGIVFAIGAGLFALGIMGGGDVKLFAVTALWAGGPFIVLLLVTTAAAGGILALWWDRLLRFFSPTTPSLKAANGRPAIPYGAAIAAGGLIVAVNLV